MANSNNQVLSEEVVVGLQEWLECLYRLNASDEELNYHGTSE